MSVFIGPRQKHDWNEKPEKPWTCKLCGFYTANLRHIENGFCRHEWGGNRVVFVPEWVPCARCGVILNNRNAENPCIGAVKLEMRHAEGEGIVYTDDEPIVE